MDMKNLAYLSVIIITVIIALIYGQSLLVPFILGLLLWFIIHEFKAFLNKIPFIGKYFPSWVTTLFSSLFLIGLLALIVEILIININNLSQSYESYEMNITYILADINQHYNLNIIDSVNEYIREINVSNMLTILIGSLSNLMSNVFIILLYAVFVLLEETYFADKMKQMFVGEQHYERFNAITSKIEDSIANYLKLKTFVSLLTGVLSYLALLFIGVDAPGFWAFLIFILNFIPTIGSLVATLFPAVFCILQFGEFSHGLLVFAIVGSVQLVVGNFVEPRVMGSSMNISPLVTIAALSFWGLIWGITGMILSVPITVVMIIIMSQFEKTRNIAVLLSEKGEIDSKVV